MSHEMIFRISFYSIVLFFWHWYYFAIFWMLYPCPPSCPYLHRTTGDTERKYHLRYYKTGTCIHETDARGHCVKNGLHCAFAHGPHDLRPPVYDIRWHAKQIVVSLFPANCFTRKPHTHTTINKTCLFRHIVSSLFVLLLLLGWWKHNFVCQAWLNAFLLAQKRIQTPDTG